MIIFTYPGQGSQSQGMGAAWQDHPSWELVEEASDIAGRNIAHLLCEADDETLRQTRNSQLATFLTSMIALDALTHVGIAPSAHAGHSLGEYSALAASGAVSFADATGLVTERGEAMQSAAEEQDGTMAAVLGLPDDEVEAACESVEGDVWVANYNAIGQVVIAGSPDLVVAAGAAAKARGAKRVMSLPVGGAFHTPYMSSAAERVEKPSAWWNSAAPTSLSMPMLMPPPTPTPTTGRDCWDNNSPARCAGASKSRTSSPTAARHSWKSAPGEL